MLKEGYWLPCFLPSSRRFCQRKQRPSNFKANSLSLQTRWDFIRLVHCVVKVCNIRCSFSKSGLEKMDWEILEEPLPVTLTEMKVFYFFLSLPKISLYHQIVNSWAQGCTHTHTHIQGKCSSHEVKQRQGVIHTSLCRNLACLGTRRATCKELREWVSGFCSAYSRLVTCLIPDTELCDWSPMARFKCSSG